MKSHDPNVNQPSQFELAQLAAILSSTNEAIRGYSLDHSQAVTAALNIWHESGMQLAGHRVVDDFALQRLKILGDHKAALRVGKHHLPEIPMEFVMNDSCSLDEFLVAAIGLSEKTDRMRWFRAFLKAWTEVTLDTVDETFPFQKTYLEIARKRPSKPKEIRPRETPVRMSETEEFIILDTENIEYYRENGIKEPAGMAKAFRMWRMTMKNPDTKALKPYSLAIAIASAEES